MKTRKICIAAVIMLLLSVAVFASDESAEVILPEGETVIKNSAYENRKDLKHIKIPSSVETIERYAFRNSGLEEITIPSNVKKIEHSAFSFCKNLKKIVIEEGALTEIRSESYGTCGAIFQTENLQELYLPKSITYIETDEFKKSWYYGKGFFAYSYTHPPMTVYGYSGTYAEKYARQNALNFVVLDETYEEDDTINVNAGVPLRQSMESSMLYVTDSDDYYVWLGNVEMLCKYTYKMDFTFRRIDDEPFENAGEIAKRIRVNGEPIEKYGIVDSGRAISISYIYDALEACGEELIPFHFETETDEYGNLIITGMSGDEIPLTVEIPSEIDGVAVKYINVYMYKDKNIKKIIFSEGINCIGSIINNSDVLETIVLPETLEVLYESSFWYCKNLKNVNFENVKIIADHSFSNCNSLNTVNLSSAELIHDNAFYGIWNLTIYGAAGSEAERFAKKKGYTFIEIDVPEKEEPTIREKTGKLYGLGLFKGVGTDEDGNPDFAFFDAVTRTEAVVMLVRMLGKDAEAENHAKTHPFTDVPEWADGYISYAYENGLANGVSETFFDAEETVTHEMFLTFMLRALGYSDSGENADFDWEKPWALANENGITERSGSYGKCPIRYEMADMVYRTLFANLKNSETRLFEKLIESGVFTTEQWNEA